MTRARASKLDWTIVDIGAGVIYRHFVHRKGFVNSLGKFMSVRGALQSIGDREKAIRDLIRSAGAS